jgi:large subunit ribosomal protein L17e
VSSQGKDLRVHYKNTYEVGKAIKGMLVKKAQQYLREVLAHTRCIPYTKYDGSMGRTGQAIQFGLTKGRWPEKSVRIVLGLLQNVLANAEVKKVNTDKLAVKRVIVNQAVKGRRRTYRAHGRINAYLSSNCHVEIYCEETKERVKKEREELSKKIEKLENLIGKVKTDNMPNHKKLLDSLSNEQKKLLKKQLRVMKEYRHILDRRLSIWVEED